jgi:hypothetical protein
VHNLSISNYTLLFNLCNDFRGCKVCVVSEDRSPPVSPDLCSCIQSMNDVSISYASWI